MKGIVKWYSMQKGYGVIQCEDGEDVVFYYSLSPGVVPSEGDLVTFEKKETDKGPLAENVQVVRNPI